MSEGWWIWVVAGLLIGVLELLVAGYVFLGFAIGGVLTGLFVYLGLLPSAAPASFALFAILSLLAWFVMRRLLGSQAGEVTIITHDINEN